MSASNQKGSMQKTLSLWNFFTIGFGAIIGTGWVLMVGDWMIIGGGPVAAMIAFIIGAVFLLPMELYSENLLQQSLFPAASLNM